MDITFDRQGNLYVINQNNHRVQKFDIDKDFSFVFFKIDLYE